MADAAVKVLLENLIHELKDNYVLISKVGEAVRELDENKKFFKSFLKKFSGKKLQENDTLRTLVENIRNVIYDADDAIDTFNTQAAVKKAKKTNILSVCTHLIKIATDVNVMCAEMKKTYGDKDKYDLASLNVDDGQDDKPLPQPILREANDVVGLEDVVTEIVGYLTGRTQHLDVITIVGMPGLGKTTLTRKIYNEQQIIIEFPTRLWVYVSSDFKEKEVFLSILKQLKTKLNEDEYGKKDPEDLAKEIAQELDGEKFLLVMDDVWEPSHWEKLRRALPERNTTGKVMITSRHLSVGHATKSRVPHELRKMDIHESYELLRREVFGKVEKFPIEFAGVGKEIASKCAGLPLAIVVIGGVLLRKVSRSVSKWEKVAESVSMFLNEEDPDKRMYGVISVSYRKLPYHLQECFLYMGMFPEDSKIPAWKLIRMWIAEGLIEPKEGITMENQGEFYLDELISRNLVSVDKLKSDGNVKTCRMHDMLRDFCKREGGSYLKEIRETGDGGLQSVALNDRRLSIHSRVKEFLSNNPKGASVRSFITFSENIEMPTDKFSVICATFKPLRVLEAEPLTIGKIPNAFYHLILLRYLVLSLKDVPPSRPFSKSKPPSLPVAFEDLWNLQTLVVKTKSRVLDIQANIMNMTQLKHVKSSASITLANPSKSAESEKLQTLCMVSPGSYTEAILGKARKLKTLGIRGKLASFLDAKAGSVNCLSKLTKLEKLKLTNDVFPDSASSGKLEGLHCKFPTVLKSLTLKATYLDWTNMSVLALLENLEVLKLKDKAFEGSKWNVKHGGFSSLIYLHIERTDLAIWEAEAHHFPMLKTLKLHNCEKLQEIPSDIPQLKHLELKNCKEDANDCANKIAEAKKKIDPTFKISISLS